MTHNKMLDRQPSVSITRNQNELKVYQGNIVYLNDGDNFELRFFNPTNFKVGVEILFNSVPKGDAFLVLNPGQDLILDRFLDEQRKMIFETYVVDGNNEKAVEAIQQNGLITFNFYKEYYNSHIYQNNEVNINYNYPPKPQNYNTYSTTRSNFSGIYTKGLQGTKGSKGSKGPNGPIGVQGTTGGSSKLSSRGINSTVTGGNTTTTLGVANSTFTSSVSPGMFVNESDLSFSSSNSINMNQDFWFPSSSAVGATLSIDALETGRIEMGDVSNQKLKSVNAQFAQLPFYEVSYKIMPYSALNRTVGEVRQYCPHCSYRIRKNTWLFCPKCGNGLD